MAHQAQSSWRRLKLSWEGQHLHGLDPRSSPAAVPGQNHSFQRGLWPAAAQFFPGRATRRKPTHSLDIATLVSSRRGRPAAAYRNAGCWQRPGAPTCHDRRSLSATAQVALASPANQAWWPQGGQPASCGRQASCCQGKRPPPAPPPSGLRPASQHRSPPSARPQHTRPSGCIGIPHRGTTHRQGDRPPRLWPGPETSGAQAPLHQGAFQAHGAGLF